MDKSRTTNERLAVAENRLEQLVKASDSHDVFRRAELAEIDIRFRDFKADITSLETRVRHLERGMYVGIGGLAMLQIVIQIFNHHA